MLTDSFDAPTLSRAEFYAKLDIFIERLQRERNEMAKTRYDADENSANWHTIRYDDGQRFVRVVDRTSVSYFVEKDTGVIFGAKSWKIYNPNREYGTLDTLDEYEWGDYYAKRKDGKDTLVPKANRR